MVMQTIRNTISNILVFADLCELGGKIHTDVLLFNGMPRCSLDSQMVFV